MAKNIDKYNEEERLKRRKKKKANKIWVILILTIIVLFIFILLILKEKGGDNPSSAKVDLISSTSEAFINKSTNQEAAQKQGEASEVKSEDKTTEPLTKAVDATPVGDAYNDGITIFFSKSEIGKWYLKLVNPYTDPLPRDYAPALSQVQDYSVHQNIVDPLQAMIAAAEKDGVTLSIISAYRSYDKQKSNFDARVSTYISQGMSESEAKKKTATIIAVPGTSEHHLGLACDFNSLDQSFSGTKAGKWLNDNAYKYGFILRYEEDTTDITGIIYEPWHFRYVTVGHARKIHQMGITLEEYIDWLKKQ